MQKTIIFDANNIMIIFFTMLGISYGHVYLQFVELILDLIYFDNE